MLSPSLIQAEGKFGSDIKIKIIHDDTQREGVFSIFDVSMEPGEKKTFKLELENKSDIEQTLIIKPGISLTARNGQIYVSDLESNDLSTNIIDKENTMINWFKFKGDPEVTIKEKEKIILPFEVDVPPEVAGIYSGGIIIQYPQKVNQYDDKNIQIKQVAQRGISFILTVGETSEPLIKFESAALSKSSFLEIELQNPNNSLTRLKEAILTVENEKTKETKVIKLDNMFFASNTKINYAINWPFDKIKSGDYTISLNGNITDRDESIKKEIFYKHTITIPKDLPTPVINTKSNNGSIKFFTFLLIAITILQTYLLLKQRSRLKNVGKKNDKT